MKRWRSRSWRGWVLGGWWMIAVFSGTCLAVDNKTLQKGLAPFERVIRTAMVHLTHADPQVRRQGAMALIDLLEFPECEERGIVSALTLALKEDTDPGIRFHVIAFYRSGVRGGRWLEEFVPALITAIQRDPHPKVRKAALANLSGLVKTKFMSDRMVHFFSDHSPDLVVQTFSLIEQERDREAREHAVYFLEGVLALAARYPEWFPRHPEAVTLMVRLYSRETDPQVKKAWVRVLGQTGYEEAGVALLNAYPAERDPGVKRALVAQLAGWEDDRAIRLLREAAQDPDAGIQKEAKEALLLRGKWVEEGFKERNP